MTADVVTFLLGATIFGLTLVWMVSTRFANAASRTWKQAVVLNLIVAAGMYVGTTLIWLTFS